MASMEYVEGFLILDYVTRSSSSDKEGILCSIVQMIAKEKIKRIYFDDENVSSRLPFLKQ